MESRLEELTMLLHLGSVNDVPVVGISGMGGIGKTTLCRALYERISNQYDFRCYIDDVSKIYRDSSILGVQKQLLSQSLNEKNLEICNLSEGTCLAWTRLRGARALIVLDNVDQVEQLNMFTGSRDTLLRECLGGGSGIIIVSRDQHILKTHGADDVYQVQPLTCKDAVQLFCKKAFKSNTIKSDYQKLTHEVLSNAEGHPLAIKVLGSSLFGRDVSEWTSALARLRENKSKSILDVLRISFDQLEDTDKEIFLDIACFSTFYSKQYLQEILDFRGFHPKYGLQVLVDKSLITMNIEGIHMHGLLKDLGKCIVQEKSPKEPRKWSRLWRYKDFHKVMSDNKAAKTVEAIVIEYLGNLFQTTMRVDAISKMRRLELLILNGVNFQGSLNYLSNELRYLSWFNYPFECLPPSFEPNKLVVLFLHYSNIKQLWEGRKPLHSLRRLELSHSINLIELPDFGEALNLERLDLKGCIQLRQIHPSIGHLRKLTFLNLANCESLVSLPNSMLGLNSLEYVSLSGCSKMYIEPGAWTWEEDSKLIAYITRYGCWNWRLIPKFAGLARCGKSCRLRWMNYLRPSKEETTLKKKINASLKYVKNSIKGHRNLLNDSVTHTSKANEGNGNYQGITESVTAEEQVANDSTIQGMRRSTRKRKANKLYTDFVV